MEFIADLADLKLCVEELSEKYPGAALFIRGDANVNINNKKRVALLNHFIFTFSLKSVNISHKTYHHFTGEGSYDSNVDILLHTSSLPTPEALSKILCKLENPLILSHHDIILSNFALPPCPNNPSPGADSLTSAPRLTMTRKRISWSADGASVYAELLSPHLQNIRKRWLDPGSLSSMSILINMTNIAMSSVASLTNKSVTLNKSPTYKSKKIPWPVLRAKRKLAAFRRKMKVSDTNYSAYKAAKSDYKRTLRHFRVKSAFERDQKLCKFFEQNPRSAFNFIKSCRNSAPTKIDTLKVGNKIYRGSAVPDGFFDSMSSIKTCNLDTLKEDDQFAEHLSNYKHIVELCKDKRTIPPISLSDSTKLLGKMKKNVTDIFSITALHYINAGNEGLLHFNFLINAVISDANNATLDELNLVLGLIYFKGHKKDKTCERSYRTISTCPFLAKAADLYLRDLFSNQWDACQAPTQYQGKRSNHELAALLVTEVIQHSLNVAKKPVFLLCLDAQSAFDRCHRQILCAQLYKAGITGSALLFMDNRLASRATAYQWDGAMMGPAKDDTGFEQGGVNSSDFYKLYNNEQLTTTQSTNLGVNIQSSVVSAIGVADDVVHVANSINDLHLLVTITEQYCNKFKVTLVPSKTKLLAFANANHQFMIDLAALNNPVKIANIPVEFSTEAEHVGIVRSTTGNTPNILHRVACHRKSLGSVLSAGLARSHRANPAASLRTHQVYQTPVLFSGLAALVLTKAEIKIIDSHYLKTLQNLQRLHDKTPRAVVLFMAGSLPGEAILHSRQLTLFSIISKLPCNDPLRAHAHYALTESPPSARSWFHQVRHLCLQYSLPDPLHLLLNPPTRLAFKTMVKTNVNKYWENLLRQETLQLSSLIFFQTSRLSLRQPSILWLLAGSNSYEVSKSLVVARMISGRYKSDFLSRHWTPSNRQGFCLEESCDSVRGDIAHMLITCPGLSTTRERLRRFLVDRSSHCPPLLTIMTDTMRTSPEIQTQFFLDPCHLPPVTALCCLMGPDILGHIHYLTRTFVYYMHRAKMLSLGRWPSGPSIKTNKTRKNLAKSKNEGGLPGHNSHVYVDKFSNTFVAGTLAASYPYPATTTTTELISQHESQYQHAIFDGNIAQCSVPSPPVPVPVVGPLAPGLHVRGEAAGDGRGHDHAHEDTHQSLVPNICSPKDDKTLVVCSGALGP